MSNGIMMMDSDSYPTEEMSRDDATATLMQCEQLLPSTSATTALGVPTMASGYGPVEMKNALRIMTHAGRILWRAAMEAIPGGVGSHNPSLGVLSKLFLRSFGKSHTRTNKQNYNNNIERKLPVLSYWSTKDTDHDNDDVMDTIPECTDDSWDPLEEDVGIDDADADDVGIDDDGEFRPQPKKRKPFFGMASLLPSVVSDSDHGELQSQPKKRKTFFGIESLLPSGVSDSDDGELRPQPKKRKIFFGMTSLLPSVVSDSDDVELRPQPKKRKTFFGMTSLLPSVVSDSDDGDDVESDVNRSSKRVRRSFEREFFENNNCL